MQLYNLEKYLYTHALKINSNIFGMFLRIEHQYMIHFIFIH